MTSMSRQYSAAASQARDAVDKTADVWTEGARTVTGRLFGLPQVDLVPAVERYFDLVQRAVEINRRLAVRWAEAAGTLSGAVREKAESAGEVVREKAEAAGDIAREQAENAERAAHEQAAKAEQAEKELARQAEREQAEKAERAAHEQAAKAEQAEKELARQARQAEREHARRAHQRARARYEGLPKAELSDLLAKRDLPKTGNIDELIERLVEADSR
jgi:flagellar biosynthesis GTPase FlhF